MVGWHHLLDDRNLSTPWEIVKDRGTWHAAVHGVAKRWTIIQAQRKTKM